MKTKEEIEQLAKAQYSYNYGEDTSKRRYAFEEGYTQCQQDMAIEITELKMICKNIQNDFKALNDMLNSLNKQD